MVLRPYRPRRCGSLHYFILYFIVFKLYYRQEVGSTGDYPIKTVDIIQESISRQLASNKAFKRGSSFCSSSRSYLENWLKEVKEYFSSFSLSYFVIVLF